MKASKWSFTPFKGLKEDLEKKGFSLQKNSTGEIKTDDETFRDAMADVREIKKFRKILVESPPQIEPCNVQKDQALDILSEIIRGKKKIRLTDTGEYIDWVDPHLRKDITQKLHQGKFSVQDFLDLHGMTVEKAEESFRNFLREARQKRFFCVKVIHGRGLRSQRGPVLKEAMKRWLQGPFRKWIYAYSTAKDCDGGLGATYILLK